MSNTNEKGKPESRRTFESWNPPAWLEPAFIYIAVSVALVAALALLLWVLVSFILPFSIYPRETGEIPLENGQTLRVNYSNLVRAGDPPAQIVLSLSGISKAKVPVQFTIEIPPGLTIVDPTNQVHSKKLLLTAAMPGNDTEPEKISLGVVNSWSMNQIDGQPLIIKSTFLSKPVIIPISAEPIFWSYIRGIVNNTLNDKSALILLVTGFLSGAGTLVLQYMKSHRDRTREDREKRRSEFREQLKENPVEALVSFSQMVRDESEDSDYSIKRPLVEAFGWEDKLQKIILEKLKNRDYYFDAKRAAEVLTKVCAVFDLSGQAVNFQHSRSLALFCELVCADDRKNHHLTEEDTQCLLNVNRRWHELRPLVTDLLHDFAIRRENLPVISKKFALEESEPESETARRLLRDANIHGVIQRHIDELGKIPKTAIDDMTKLYIEAVNKINEILIQDIYWRWQETSSGRERRPSDKVLRWLFSCFSEELVDTEFSLGSEYAELENRKKHQAVELPIFEQIRYSDAVIVFGEEGTGKTFAALRLMDEYTSSTQADVFPVYAPYERGGELKDWLVGTIARAITNFIADNPQKFITSPDSRKTAMGRLMLWHSQNLETLRFNLHSSSANSSTTDVEQVIEYIRKFKPLKIRAKITKDEMLSSLYLAYPAGFEQTCFLWDIPASSPQDEVEKSIKEMAGLTVALSRQNVVLKIFAPLAVKDAMVGNLGGLRQAGDLTWSDEQVLDLLNKKMKTKFENLWDSRMRETVGKRLVQQEDFSPRRLVRLLLRLMDHVDSRLSQEEKPLQERETLKPGDFDQVFPGLAGKK